MEDDAERPIVNRELYENLLKRGLPPDEARRFTENPELLNTPEFPKTLVKLGRRIITASTLNFAADRQANRALTEKYRRMIEQEEQQRKG